MDKPHLQIPNNVVSDALAKNSRQLLYAHLYNYLIENKLYDTARSFLNEADVPYKKGPTTANNVIIGGVPSDLPSVKMLMTSPDTFLLEWWQSLWALHSYVQKTAATDDPAAAQGPANALPGASRQPRAQQLQHQQHQQPQQLHTQHPPQQQLHAPQQQRPVAQSPSVVPATANHAPHTAQPKQSAHMDYHSQLAMLDHKPADLELWPEQLNPNFNFMSTF